MSKSYFFLISSLLILSACSSGGGSGGTPITVQPKANCSTVTTYPGGIEITGFARYQYRADGNGAVAGPNPIRSAEIVVLDSAGNTVQCGTTHSTTGAFNVTVPNPATNLKLRVNSRIHTSLTNIYILNNPADKDDYYIEHTFSASANTNIGTLTALATGTLEGGAFNILDKMLTTDLFLQAETAGCGTPYPGCTPFTTHPALQVFWTPGRSPGEFGAPGNSSFYLVGVDEIYLIGGADGDVDLADTDHFDDSIIIHEYGHFIEDAVSVSDSPGGQHGLDDLIDARLAWGEGWGDFIQAAITNNPIYRDTYGNGGGGGLFFPDVDLEDPDSIDNPADFTSDGEGIFHEIAIARLLWDAIDAGTDTGTDNIQSNFSELWAVLSGTTSGFAATGHRFRNMALFHEIQDALPANTDWSTLRTMHKHGPPNRLNYGLIVSTSGGACGTPYPAIQAANAPGMDPENGTSARSNQFESNDFYQYNHPGGAFSLVLNYTTTGGGLGEADLDLFVFRDRYTFISSNLSSNATYALSPGITRSSNLTASETVSGNLAAGSYMINVRSHTGSGLRNSATYTMTVNGVNLCR